MNRLFIFIIAAILLVEASTARAITVSGKVVESDNAPVGGVTITVELVGGELGNLTTTTAANGTWSVSDPLFSGNIKVTPSSASFTFAPASRATFTFNDLPDQNFTATPTVARQNITVLNGFSAVLSMGATQTLETVAPGVALVPAFIIRNDGTLPLNNISVSLTGTNVSEFGVQLAPTTTLAPGAQTVLAIRFTASVVGVRTATMLIASDDPNEHPFSVNLSAPVVSLIVTNTQDSGPGSLRQAVANAVLTGSIDAVTFSPDLSGQTIAIATEIVVGDASTIIVDASALPGGITLDSHVTRSRFFRCGRAGLQLTGLTMTGGGAVNAVSPNRGAAVISNGNLVLNRCVISGNSSTELGAIACMGDFSQLTATDCTFSGNSSFAGGAIHCEGSATITRSTFTGNSANTGGAIDSFNPLTLTHCTISGNVANGGGGIYRGVAPGLTVNFCIIAGNQGGSFPNILGPFTNNGSITSGNALLAPLDNYGGRTPTMALLPGSPARDAVAGSTATVDQRGFPIVGVPDIGAYEAGTLTNYNAFIWESLPASATAAQHATAFDFDGDGANNGQEFLALTIPADPASYLRITQLARNGDDLDVTFPTVAGRNYSLESTTNFITYAPIPGSTAGTGNPVTIPIGPVNNLPSFFVRARVGP